ncbi:MAG: hypothetical protein ILP12_06980, partial [Lachnospiraceae bacterium]|nr:hypothetical protein [Lachnospiraceae bacterium]
GFHKYAIKLRETQLSGASCEFLQDCESREAAEQSGGFHKYAIKLRETQLSGASCEFLQDCGSCEAAEQSGGFHAYWTDSTHTCYLRYDIDRCFSLQYLIIKEQRRSAAGSFCPGSRVFLFFGRRLPWTGISASSSWTSADSTIS